MGISVRRTGLQRLGRSVAAGVVSGTMVLAGCGASSTSSGVPSPAQSGNGTAKSVYVVQQPAGGAGSVLEFPATANGAASLAGTVIASGITVTTVFVDTAGQVYAGGVLNSAAQLTTGEIEIFAAGASGAASPVRTITSGPSTFSSSFYEPAGMWVDSGGLVYVVGQNASLSVFPSNANGAATPYRFIQGAQTQITNPVGVTVDGSGNIYVANATPTGGSVLVFGQAANGDAPPLAVITGTNTAPLINPTGISLDTAGNLYVLNNTAAGGASTVVEFAPGAAGAATPVKTIGGSSTGLTGGAGLATDEGNNVYVLNEGAGSAAVLVFGPTQTGNVAPATQFSSSSWTAPVPGGIAVF